jgi:hypothetical protein
MKRGKTPLWRRAWCVLRHGSHAYVPHGRPWFLCTRCYHTAKVEWR